MSLPPIPETLRNAYDPERFRADGHRLIDALADLVAALLNNGMAVYEMGPTAVPAVGGIPSRAAIQRTTATSAGTAVGPISYTAMPLLSSAATRSASAAPGIGGGTWWPR